MLTAGTHDQLAEAIALEIKRHQPRPFAAFRGDYRRPVKVHGNKHRANQRRLNAAPVILDRSSSVKRLMRAQRIFWRLEAARIAEEALKTLIGTAFVDPVLTTAVEALKKHGSERKAAEAIGVPRSTFRRQLARAREIGILS